MCHERRVTTCQTNENTERLQQKSRRTHRRPLTEKTRYWVTVLTASPTLNPAPEMETQTDETSSTSVTFTTPILVAMRRRTLPVLGSLISRVTRCTSSWSPTFTPFLPPTLSTMVSPSTAATRPSTTMVRVTSLMLLAITSLLMVSVAVFTASPMMVFWK